MHLLQVVVLYFAALVTTAFYIPFGQKPESPLPLIIWHGLGDNFENPGLTSVGELAESANPGTYVYIIRLGADGGADRTASFWGNLNEQVQTVCDEIKANPLLAGAPAIDALGLSQGGIFLRGLIERCEGIPPVRSLVTFGSPHNGIADCNSGDTLCQLFYVFKSQVWGGYAQSNIVPAQYFRTVDMDTKLPSQEYLDSSNFLADINNEREAKNKSYATRFAKLEKFVMFEFEEDTIVIPKESTFFSEVILETGEVIPLRNRTLYKEDWLGLKALDLRGAIEFRTTPGNHMSLSDEILTDAFKQYFGSSSKSISKSTSKLEF